MFGSKRAESAPIGNQTSRCLSGFVFASEFQWTNFVMELDLSPKIEQDLEASSKHPSVSHVEMQKFLGIRFVMRTKQTKYKRNNKEREGSWLSWEVPDDWRKVDIIPAAKKGDLQNYRQDSLASVLGKVMEKILPEALSKHMKDKKMVGSSHN
ncbi:hypothetical protein DUI87_08105 [Hirundo rustica rustica]|uniref:Uncharacterized protein n=1 Tax=Hirundo rustica rustica TaxID=333673 RepID=A0A3M0KYT5_HIRRU|nr:hypothetical protein DUI87_08105 [Hirundo rustica rustica]